MTALSAPVEPITAGDLMSKRKWVRARRRHLGRRFGEAGHAASPPTVRHLLAAHRYRLHGNTKQLETGASHPDLGRRFRYVAAQRPTFGAAGLPQVSVDAERKELIGSYRNIGRAWGWAAAAVNVHDFRRDVLGRAVQYGMYDLTHHRATVYVGQSADTLRFAVELLILANSSGSHSACSRVCKQQLQAQLCDRYGLTVTVCHDHTGCSKWNPIEHRLFGLISLNWAGRPLATWDILLGYLRGTTTEAGLTVRATLDDGVYQTGECVTDAELAALNLTPHEICPTWNHPLRPRSPVISTPTPMARGGNLLLHGPNR